MKQMKFGPDHLFNLYQDLQMLKPFLIGSKPLTHTVNHLAEFICKSLPVCRVALVRLGKQKNIKDPGFWSNGPDNLHDLYHQFLEEQLPFLTSSFVRGHVLDDSSLENLITVTLNRKLDYYPTVFPITHEGKLVGFCFFGKCETYGSIGPNEFIPLLEESGLIHAVGKWIFKQAVDTCAHWVEKMPDFTMSINLSYLQLTQEDFIPFMQKTLAEKHLQPRHIIVELTESCIASSIDMLADTFKKIRSLGIQIAMDDFGTGYSSLDILKNCPADIVKIDRAFVKDIQTSSFDATFIKFIVELCHNVQITVYLEGVENENEYQFVKPMGLDFIQGYYFGHPQPAQDFYLLLIANNK